MIRKTKNTIWLSNHEHHDAKRKFSKLEGWEPLAKSHAVEQGEVPTNSGGAVEYPAALLAVFVDAVKRCPTVSVDPQVMEGQPCIAGTRIPIRSVLRAVEQYGSIQDAQRCYPHLTVAQVEDALYFSQIVLELSSGLDETSVAPR